MCNNMVEILHKGKQYEDNIIMEILLLWTSYNREAQICKGQKTISNALNLILSSAQAAPLKLVPELKGTRPKGHCDPSCHSVWRKPVTATGDDVNSSKIFKALYKNYLYGRLFWPKETCPFL